MDRPARDFTLRQLRTFVCVADMGSFSRAAEQMGISQAAVSDQIKTLEQHLGKQLFIRQRGSTPRLTQHGITLLADAETLLQTSQSLTDAPSPANKQIVRLCIGPHLLNSFLKPMLPRFYRDHPEVDLILVPPIERPDIPMALDKKRIDIAVYQMRPISPGWPNEKVLRTIPTVMIAQPGINAQLTTGQQHIEDIPFILPWPAHANSGWINERLRYLNIKPRHPFRYVDMPDVAQQMVEDGQGISIMMLDQVARSIDEGRLEVIGPQIDFTWALFSRSNSVTPAMYIVEDLLTRALARPSGAPNA